MPTTRKLGRKCDCGSPIYDQSITGRCRPCHLARLATPEMAAQRAKSIRRKWETDPAFRIKKRDNLRLARAAARAKPEYMQFLADSGARLQTYRTPQTEAKRIAAVIAANKLRPRNPWLPDEYKAEYRRMVSNRRFKASEAKAIILAEIEAKKAQPDLSPFERQMLALERGAALQDNVRLDLHSDSAAELRAKLA